MKKNQRINLFPGMFILSMMIIIWGICFVCLAAPETDKTTYEYSADKMTHNKNSGVTVLEGQAKFSRSNDDYLHADQITIYKDVNTDEIIKIESVGNVEMKEKDMTATCEHSIFYEQENRIEFQGSIDKPAIVDSGDNKMEAPFIIYFRDDENIVATGFLFSVDMEFQSDLDNGAISDGLRGEFEKNRIKLSDSASVSKDGTEEARWSITDGDKTYNIKKEEDKLEVLAKDGVRGHVTVEVKEEDSEEETKEK